MPQLKLEMGDFTLYVDMPEEFDDLEAGMLHVETALRRLFERHGMIKTYNERLKELGYRPDPLNHVKYHLDHPRLGQNDKT